MELGEIPILTLIMEAIIGDIINKEGVNLRLAHSEIRLQIKGNLTQGLKVGLFIILGMAQAEISTLCKPFYYLDQMRVE